MCLRTSARAWLTRPACYHVSRFTLPFNHRWLSNTPWCRSTITSIAALIDPLNMNTLEGGTITVNGFIRTVRKQKRIAFAAVGDGSSVDSLQVVLRPEQADRSVKSVIDL
jgi:hypothetical protein